VLAIATGAKAMLATNATPTAAAMGLIDCLVIRISPWIDCDFSINPQPGWFWDAILTRAGRGSFTAEKIYLGGGFTG
jgi:hypothetical protein